MDMFTLYRKYRVGPIVSAQNLAQIGSEKSEYRQTISANSTTKMIFGNNTPEDNSWWELELGDKREWKFTNDYHTQDAKKGDGSPGYDENYKNIEYKWVKNYAAGKVQALKFKQILYKTKDLKGKNIVGKSKLDFLDSRYKEPQKIKKYNFAKFSQGISSEEKENKFDFSKIDFSNLDKDDPNTDGPIVRNPNRTFEFNRTGANYINPIRVDKSLSQAIEDFNKTKNNQD